MKETQSCYHCGDTCPPQTIVLEEKHFCCEGCKMVYEILEGKGLTAYYEIEDKPGISFRRNKRIEDYTYLDEEEVLEKLIRFKKGSHVHLDLRIPQIHCASCVWLLEHIANVYPGILKSEVNFLEKKLYIQADLDVIKLSELAKLISNLGYAPDINLQDLDSPQTSKRDHSFYYKLSVAGFCTGNIMLMSFPEYLGLEEHSFQLFFSWINLALAIPVLLYSAQIFFKSAWQSLQMGRPNIDVPVCIGIVALFLQSLYEILSQTGPGYLDSLAGLVFFLLLGKWFQQKSYEQLNFDRDFRSYFPLSAKKIVDKEEVPTLLSQLKTEDVLWIQHEEIIPADAILLDKAAYLDYSFVSGESVPISLTQGEKIYAGGKLIGKGINIQLLKPVSESYLTQLWKKYKQSTAEKKGIRKFTDRLATHFTYIVLSIALLAGTYWMLTENLGVAIQVCIAVLIVACPCGLALSSPIVLGNTMRILGKYGFYLKDANILEGLREMNHWVFDKTGTLTQALADESFQSLHTLSLEEKSLVLALAQESKHPISRQIKQELAGIPAAVLESSKEYPGKGITGTSDKHQIAIGNARLMSEKSSASLEQGMTGIAMDGRIVAGISRKEQIRKELPQVLNALGKVFHLSLLTGDAKDRALSLKPYFPPNSKLLWDQLPEDKLSYIKRLQAEGQKVIMMGDGLNDAGALMQADLGIAVSENLSSFSPASDVIIDSKSFPLLPQMISYARTSHKLLKGALIISLLYNIVGLGFAVQGLLSPLIAAILMPLSSISVIFWGIASTHLWAKKIGLTQT